MIFHFPNINQNVLRSQAMNMPIHFYPSVSSRLEDEIKVLKIPLEILSINTELKVLFMEVYRVNSKRISLRSPVLNMT